MFILKLTKSLDFLGPNINFTIRKQSIFKTVLGGILSITTVILYFVCLFSFGTDLIIKQNPNVIIQNLYSENYKFLNITNRNFLFAWQYQNDFPIDSDINDISIEYFSYDGIGNSKEIKFNFTNCSNKELSFLKDPLVINKSSYFDYDKINCINLFQNNYSLGGLDEISNIKSRNNAFNEFKFLTIKFSIQKKENKTLNFSEEDLEKIFSSDDIFFSIYLPQLIFAPKNFTHPFKYLINEKQINLRMDTINQETYYLNSNKLSQDSGYIFSSTVEEEYLAISRSVNNINKMYDKDEFIFNFKNMKKIDLYTCVFLIDRNFIEYSRSYMKLQDLLGNVKGFMEMIELFLFLFIHYFSGFKMNSFLFNKFVILRKASNDKQIISNLNNNHINHLYNNNFKKIEMIRIKSISDFNNDNFHNIKEISSNNLLNSDRIYFNNKKSSSRTCTKISSMKNKINTNSTKKIKEIDSLMKKLDLLEESKLDSFMKSFCNNLMHNVYSCSFKLKSSKKNKQIFQKEKLFKSYLEKIYNKLDVIHYLKKIKQFNIIRDCYLNNELDKMLFNIISSNLFNIRINSEFEVIDSKPKMYKDKKKIIQ